MKYFKCIEHPLDLTKYTICVTDDLCTTFAPLRGTYGIVPARVLGLSYEQYICYLFQHYRDKVSFNSYTGAPMFVRKEDAENLAGFLDARMYKLMEKRNGKP